MQFMITIMMILITPMKMTAMVIMTIVVMVIMMIAAMILYCTICADASRIPNVIGMNKEKRKTTLRVLC